jgi:hypothetical protein
MRTNDRTLPKTAEGFEAIIQPGKSRKWYREQHVKVLEEMIYASRNGEHAAPMETKADFKSTHTTNPKSIFKKNGKNHLVVAGHTRQRPLRELLLTDPPPVDFIHDMKKSEQVPQPGSRLSRIGEDVSEKHPDSSRDDIQLRRSAMSGSMVEAA